MKYPLLPFQPYNWEPSLQLGFGARERGGRAGGNGWQGVFNTGASADQQKREKSENNILFITDMTMTKQYFFLFLPRIIIEGSNAI